VTLKEAYFTDSDDHNVAHLISYTPEPLLTARDAEEQSSRSVETLLDLQALMRPQPLRIAIKVKAKILFIELGDVVSVQARANHVLVQCQSSAHSLRESITAVAQKLEQYGFIRIHRSVLVNILFVEEIWPVSTGEYRLRVKGGKEYTVTRTYKKRLRSLAELWIGTGAFFPSETR
jgi:DNA-binding LytR/AlgR family response regulator